MEKGYELPGERQVCSAHASLTGTHDASFASSQRVTIIAARLCTPMSFSAEIEIVRCAVFHLSAELQCPASPPVREDPGSLWTQRLTSIELDPRRDFIRRDLHIFCAFIFRMVQCQDLDAQSALSNRQGNSAAELSQVLDEDTSTSSFSGVSDLHWSSP